ncbi:unnamed protein product [Coccothraustes coccothraustes]
MSALRCALGAVVPPPSTASSRSPARKMSSAEARRPPTTPRSAERGGAGSRQEASALSAPLSPPGVVVLPPLWPLRGAWQGLGVPARRGLWAEGQRWERRARRAAAVEGVAAVRGVGDKVGSVNVEARVEALRSLVALTDPQEGKLTQSQEKVSD